VFWNINLLDILVIKKSEIKRCMISIYYGQVKWDWDSSHSFMFGLAALGFSKL